MQKGGLSYLFLLNARDKILARVVAFLYCSYWGETELT
jgi:hypothetical protein